MAKGKIIGFGNRDYRLLQRANDLKYFQIKVKETDLAIGIDREAYSDSLVSLCYNEVQKTRRQLEEYILIHPEFRTSLFPLEMEKGAPDIAVKMAEAASIAGVGPMAAVAGAVASFLGQILESYSREVIIENGGDIYLHSQHERVIAIFAGDSPFSYKIGLKVKSEDTPAGICTSSGTVGHSLSFGTADAVVIKGKSAILADAVATQAGNLIKGKVDLDKATEYVRSLNENLSIIAIKEEKMMAWGDIEIIPIE